MRTAITINNIITTNTDNGGFYTDLHDRTIVSFGYLPIEYSNKVIKNITAAADKCKCTQEDIRNYTHSKLLSLAMKVLNLWQKKKYEDIYVELCMLDAEMIERGWNWMGAKHTQEHTYLYFELQHHTELRDERVASILDAIRRDVSYLENVYDASTCIG